MIAQYPFGLEKAAICDQLRKLADMIRGFARTGTGQLQPYDAGRHLCRAKGYAMKSEAKRCTARGKLVRDTKTGAPTAEKLPDGQLADHFVLCPEDRAKGRVEPYRDSYIHEKCGTLTRMPVACAETYAVNPSYYGRTFCCGCGNYFPVGENGEFVWDKASGQKVGTRRHT